MLEEKRQVYDFDEFRLDAVKRQLLRGGEVVPLHSKAFDLLLLLVESGGRDLTKDEILETVWPGQMLEESNLTVNISAVRRALGERAAQPRYIVTMPGLGYRFVAAVRVGRAEPSGLVIVSQTISQITVTEETETNGDGASMIPSSSTSFGRKEIASPDNADSSIAVQPQSKHLATSSAWSPSLFKRPLVLAALLLCAAVLVVASLFTIYRIRQSRAAANRFRQIKLRQLTNDSGVFTAAISPDGKFFVFVHAERGKKSLRLGQTNGEAPIELRPSADIRYQGLEFAPDGSGVYYVIEDKSQNSHTLYRLPLLGGVPVKLRDNIDSSFAIAPDNKRVAFVRSDAADKSSSVVISNLDGTNERLVLTLPVNRNLTSLNFSWSPDGSMIALGATPFDDQTAAGIFLLQIASGELKPLTSPIWREIVRTAWLKDGSGLVAIAARSATPENRQIWFVALPSGDARRITNDLNSYDIALSVTSDSNNLLAVELQQIANIWVAPADDLSKAKQLTFGTLNRSDGGVGLDWTPNGKIVYTSSVAQSRTIWIMDADGANARELTPPGAFETTPSVTGDGRFIVFDSDRSGGSEIWRTNIDGSDPKQLTTCGRNSQPSVTPDGRWVVYKSACDSVGALWRVSTEGGQPIRLTEKAAWWPWVSPDGKWVACEYIIAEPWQSKLAIIPFTGGQPAIMFEVPPLANFRYGIKWTSDGTAVTYRDWGAGIWRQPVDGGSAQRLQGLPQEKIYPYGWSRDGKLFAFTRPTENPVVVLISNSG